MTATEYDPKYWTGLELPIGWVTFRIREVSMTHRAMFAQRRDLNALFSVPMLTGRIVWTQPKSA